MKNWKVETLLNELQTELVLMTEFYAKTNAYCSELYNGIIHGNSAWSIKKVVLYSKNVMEKKTYFQLQDQVQVLFSSDIPNPPLNKIFLTTLSRCYSCCTS